MKFKKEFNLALNLLIHSKLRSWLTILGIVIGIASVVSIMAISEGAQQQLEEQLSSIGADVITVSSGAPRAMGGGGSFAPPNGGGPGGMGGETESSSSSSKQKNLTARDVTVLKNVDNVLYAMGTVSDQGTMEYSGKSAEVSITGVDEAIWKEITTESLESGRFLTQGDKHSIVVGSNIVERTFEGELYLNNKVTIEGESFTIVGIVESSSSIYMPIDIARDILEDVGPTDMNSILVKIENVEISNETVNEMTEKLMFSRGILKEKDTDFSISNPKAMQETMLESIQTISLFLGAIAAISLIVGGIGIANTMFTSVLEKTRDIGIMKAIGAKNIEIMMIFLLNSGLIGLVGGIGGIIVGTAVSTAIGSYAGLGSSGGMGRGMMMFGSSSNVTPEIILIALLFSLGVGMIAGAIPARNASKMNPVDALRYE